MKYSIKENNLVVCYNFKILNFWDSFQQESQQIILLQILLLRSLSFYRILELSLDFQLLCWFQRIQHCLTVTGDTDFLCFRGKFLMLMTQIDPLSWKPSLHFCLFVVCFKLARTLLTRQQAEWKTPLRQLIYFLVNVKLISFYLLIRSVKSVCWSMVSSMLNEVVPSLKDKVIIFKQQQGQ